MLRKRLATSIYAGILFTVPGTIARATGQPFISPSLGPSAFDRRGERAQTYRIVGGHLIGAAAGLLAYIPRRFPYGIEPAMRIGLFRLGTVANP